MKYIYHILYSFLFLFIVAPLWAQVSISGEIRPRAEFRNGFKRLDSESTDPAFFIEQRSRLYLSYKESKYEVKLTLQDVRIWGQTASIFKTESNLNSIAEAWGKYHFNPHWSVKVGRQIISYDNQRFLGGLEWAQQGRRHDAMLLQYQDTTSNWTLHLGLAFNQDASTPEPANLFGTDYTLVNNYKTMQYLWAKKKMAKGFVSALIFNEGNQYGVTSDSISYRQTIGLVGKHSIGKAHIAGEVYIQTGEWRGNTVKASMFDLNFTLPLSPKTPITIGYQRLSGNKANESNFQAFIPAYGTNHAHNGYMDYFYVGNGHGNVGLQDFYLKAKWKVGKGKLQTNLHQFASAVQVNNAAVASLKSTLGTEVDLVYMVKLANAVTFHIGYSQLFATETLEELKGGDRSQIQNWAWTMLTFKPIFYKTPKAGTQ